MSFPIAAPQGDAEDIIAQLTDDINTCEHVEPLLLLVEAWSKEVEYTGLNIPVMRKRIRAMAMTNQDPADLPAIVFCVKLGMGWGNNLAQRVKHLRAEDQTKASQAIRRFSLKSKPSASDTEPTITLSRFINCFPELGMRIAHKMKPRLISGLTDKDYPTAMRYRSFGAMIPKGVGEYMPLLRAYCLYQAQVSMTLSRKLSSAVNKKVLNSQMGFIMTSISQSPIRRSIQIEMLNNPAYGIVVPGPEGQMRFAPVIMKMNDEFNRINTIQAEDY